MIVYYGVRDSSADAMRKLTLKFTPNEATRAAQASLFETVHSYELLAELKVEHEKGMCVDLIECELQEHLSIEGLRSIGKMEILNVLGSKGNKHTCLVKYTEAEASREVFKEFDLNLIFVPPSRVSEDSFVSTCIGDDESLRKFIELVNRHVGKVQSVTMKRAVYERGELLSVLTDRQREILVTAHRHGYYDYPRRIGSTTLAGKVGISKPTLVQHLRKAEGRLLDEILTGYF